MRSVSGTAVVLALALGLVRPAGASERPTTRATPVIPDSPTVARARAHGTLTRNPAVRTASGLEYIDVKVGRGAPTKATQAVSVHYTAWVLGEAKPFDRTRDRGGPVAFQLGRGQLIKGFEEGLLGLQPGGIRKVIIPSHLGYGPAGRPGVIPPAATLVFEVELPIGP
jgi:FKBP-type peptidyl-prolyl cis-trans isomerase